VISYRFGTIFRRVAGKPVNYCEVFNKGKFVSTKPAQMFAYHLMKDSIPEGFTVGCPCPKRVDKFIVIRFYI
jgi:hypothetical protein